MLELTAAYGDGWYPMMVTSAQEYASKLEYHPHLGSSSRARAEGHHPGSAPLRRGRPHQPEARALLRSKAIRAFGLAAPAELWARAGAAHPFGEQFRGYVDLIPERHDRAEIDEAISAVPPKLMEEGPLLWGMPEQVAGKLRAFGEAGLRHVVLAPVSGLVSRASMIYSLRAVLNYHPLPHGQPLMP